MEINVCALALSILVKTATERAQAARTVGRLGGPLLVGERGKHPNKQPCAGSVSVKSGHNRRQGVRVSRKTVGRAMCPPMRQGRANGQQCAEEASKPLALAIQTSKHPTDFFED